ncbi:MAG: hypothetical protein WAT38_12065, partial [Nitrospira sp.]
HLQQLPSIYLPAENKNFKPTKKDASLPDAEKGTFLIQRTSASVGVSASATGVGTCTLMT